MLVSEHETHLSCISMLYMHYGQNIPKERWLKPTNPWEYKQNANKEQDILKFQFLKLPFPHLQFFFVA